MPKTYKLELEIVLSDEEQQGVVEAARQAYAVSPASTRNDAGQTTEIPAEEFVDGPVSALMEIVQRNSMLEDLGIQVHRVSCTDPDYDPSKEDFEEEAFGSEFHEESGDEVEDEEDGLDEWESGLYLCRWPNGEFSVVKAENKRDAMVQLDEWAGAHASWLGPLETFMAAFRLDDLGQIELGPFGEETEGFIRDRCYPELEAVLSSDGVLPNDGGDYSSGALEKIKAAVARERTRLWDDQPHGPDAQTERGREMQAQMGTTGTVADFYVKQGAKRLLKSKVGEGGKPN